ncbi:MAG TPA: GGDEF domain-containing protein [Gemmatimonadaceae bacterium]|jgi:diguanylate cyclase (GGDEF)-like protein
MTTPASARQQSPPSVFTPLTEVSPEAAHEPSPEARDALRRDQSELQREVILWQRWVRYLAVLVLCAAAVMLSGRREELARLPLLIVAVGYVACVFLSGYAVRHAPALTTAQWLPAVLVTADLITIGTIIFITSPPLLSYRFLILALLSVQFAAFYFGWGLGVYATLLSAGIYVLLAHVVPPLVPGPRPHGILNVALFGVVAAVLTYTFGSFRARMNQLRLFCKVIEEGDLTSALDLTGAKYPDDLTLLARSFDAMRNGLAEQIGTDPLTGCLNRRALEARLKADWRLAKRRGTHIALAAIDLDRFKQINDTRGHPVGDIVLQQLAGIMKGTARDTDAVARFGGDEFVILLPDTGWQGALTFAERLRRRVDDFTFGPPGSPMTITISVGVALARGTDPISPEELLKEADRSLYKAKQQGRNRVFA